MSKKINPNFVKIHRNYSVEDISNLLKVHKNTVRSWLKKGLESIDDNRPILILGSVLKQFLKKQNATKKRTCKNHEIYCIGCKLPRIPVENMVNIRLINKNVACLNAVCPVCQSAMNKFISLKKIRIVMEEFNVTLPQDQKQLSDIDSFLINSDFK